MKTMTDEQKKEIVTVYRNNDIKIKGENSVPSDLEVEKTIKEHYYEILTPSDETKEKLLEVVDLDSLIEGVLTDWPKKYSSRTVDGIKIAIDNRLQLFKKKTLDQNEIENIRNGLLKRISEREGNAKVAALCRRALSNPYYLDISIFENWLTLLIKNWDKDIFADLSATFGTINEEKNIPEKIINTIIKKIGSNEKNEKDEIKLRDRNEYYKAGLRTLNNIIDIIPDDYDITNSLPSLNNFIKVLKDSKLPDVDNQIEHFLLSIFKPGKVKFVIGNDYASLNTISNIYDLCIGYLTKPEVKKQFIEHMFNHENCNVLAINKGSDILKASDKYTKDIQLYVVQKLSELYSEEGDLDESYVSTIKNSILEYIINNEENQKDSFEFFFKILSNDEKRKIAEILLNMDSKKISNLFQLHEFILDSDCNLNVKINSLASLTSDYKESSETDKRNKMSSLIKIITGTYESEVKNYALDFCLNNLKQDDDLEKFFEILWNKCSENPDIFNNLTDKTKQELKESQIKLILQSKDYNKKNSTLKRYIKFIEDVIPKEKISIYEDILNQDVKNTCDISFLHEDIQNTETYSEKLKINSIKIMCNGYKDANESVKSNIKTLLSDILIKFEKNNDQIKNIISIDFYKETLSNQEKNDFIVFLYNKCNQDGDKFRELPKMLKDDILKADPDTINHDQKKQMVMNLFDSYMNQRNDDLEDDIINYLLTDSNPSEDRRVLLLKILEKMGK